jgi:hypothetical protein
MISRPVGGELFLAVGGVGGIRAVAVFAVGEVFAAHNLTTLYTTAVNLEIYTECECSTRTLLAMLQAAPESSPQSAFRAG